MKFARGATPERPLEGNRKIRLRAIVPTDIYYHPTKVQLNRMRNVGCELIWSLQKGRPQIALRKEIEKFGSKRLCGLMSSIILPSFNSIP